MLARNVENTRFEGRISALPSRRVSFEFRVFYSLFYLSLNIGWSGRDVRYLSRFKGGGS